LPVELQHENTQSVNRLGAYPMDLRDEFQRIQSGLYGPFDEQGLPLVDYKQWFQTHGVPTKNGRFPITYTPVTIAQFGLAAHQRFLKNQSDRDYSRFLSAADWLVHHLKKGEDQFWVWEHDFSMPVYHLDPPWVSAMAQGQGMSLLLRAYEQTKKLVFLKASRAAFQAFLFPIERGGVVFTDENGNVWFEEYPSDPPSHVLNGMIFAMIGLYEYGLVTGDVDARRLFESGVITFLKRLKNFDAGYGSRYDLLTRRVVEEKYHRMHVAQLRLLFEWTGEEVFRKMADRWESAWNDPLARAKRALFPRLTPYWISRQTKRLLGYL